MLTINRRRFLLGLGSAVAAGTLPAVAAAPRVLDAADVHVLGYPTVEAVKWMGRTLEEETDGRLMLRMFHAGQLGREGDTVNLTRLGALAITRVTVATVNNAFPATRLLSLPYVFDDTAHMRRALDGPAGREILTRFETRGLVGLAFYDAGARSFYNTTRPINEPADMRGMKLRVPPADIFMELVRGLGANPTPLSYGEVFSAMQTGLIDGAENNWPSFHSSRQFEVANYWSESEHARTPEALLMSRRIYDQLSTQDQERVRSVAARSLPLMRELWDAREAEARAAVAAAGVAINEVDYDAFQRATRPMIERHLADPEAKRLYRALRDA